ncbi:hypothetical protein A8C32_11050 [Flavivirga aquatica]|uniref:CHAT domain-containing protein n=1 Tax=Flavivirga aquatica TaxID=1849968 RepID=A0A1E5TCZ7_9FLAO|nr:CHAT domain-containing protein [Flavivirga aquatica]OEK09254.1 hypothetical protein A8C32_11050 [Flavivirga aquatica]
MKKLYFFFLLINSISFSQTLEETIYVATEVFISNQNNESLQLLNQQESTYKTLVNTKDEQLALVFLQCNKGYYLDKHSKLKEAITSYEDALKRFQSNNLLKFSDFDIIESCLKPLGNLYTKTSDYTNAINTINQYIFFAEERNNINHQVSGAINLAKLYETIGKYKIVLKIIENTSKLPNISNTQKKHLTAIKITNLIALEKYEEASFINATSKFSKFNKHKNDYLIQLKKGNYNQALNAFKKAKTTINKTNMSIRNLSKFYVEEAQLYYLLNRQNNAIQSLNLALKTLIPNLTPQDFYDKNNLYPENTFIDIFDLYATMQSNTEKALQYFNLSFHVSKLLQNSWTSQEAKILNQTNNRIRSEKCISLLYNKFNETKNKTYLYDAFHYSENGKASVLKEVFQKKLRQKQFPNDSLLTIEINLLKKQEHITSLLVKEQMGNSKASRINLLSKNLSEISLKLKTIKTAILKKYPESTSNLSLETLQAKLLKDDTVLVEYFYGETAIYQFTILSKNIYLDKIILNTDTRKQITDFIHLFDNASIINNNINTFTTKAFNLFELLKFNTISTSKNVVIIPDGLLNFISFESLLTSKTSTTSYSKMPFLVKTHNVLYNSSALFYSTKNKPVETNTLLGFFPVFENTKKKLTYSIEEAHAINTEMSSKIFMYNKATKANFIKNANNYNILHLSTHANAGDFIKPANIDFYDDTLYLNELYSLNLNTNLVVLSACETGIGKLYKGEGAMSIARGFQYSGAKNVLFSLWRINDLSASQIIQSFYENYSKHQATYLANHNSKIEYIENNTISNIKKSPYYWSAFVYYGEFTKPDYNRPLFYNIGIIVFILLFIVILLLKFK